MRSIDQQLINAIQNNHSKSYLENLVNSGANINVTLKQVSGLSMPGSAPFTIAATAGNVMAMDYLRRKGVDIDQREDRTQNTGLMVASTLNNTKSVKWLLENGANIEATNLFGKTALSNAARQSIDVVKLLIENKANMNHLDKNGDTPALIALKSNSPASLEILKVLKDAGADFSIKNKEGESFLEVARRLKRQDVIEWVASSTETVKSEQTSPRYADKEKMTTAVAVANNESQNRFNVLQQQTHMLPSELREFKSLGDKIYGNSVGGNQQKIQFGSPNLKFRGQPRSANEDRTEESLRFG